MADGGDTGGFELRQVGDGAWAVVGEFDMSAAGHILKALGGDAGAVRTVDLGGVTFIDSSGLSVLVQLRARHPQLRFVNVTARTRRLLDLTGLTTLVLDDR